MKKLSLYVKNDNREDLVGYVNLKVSTPNDKIISDVLDTMEKLIISEYTRDANILKMIAPTPVEVTPVPWFSTLLTGSDSSSSKKVFGLSKYLIDRKKAGRIELKGGEWELYSMPILPSDEKSLVCIYRRVDKGPDTIKETSAYKSTTSHSGNSMNKQSHETEVKVSEKVGSLSSASNSVSADPKRKSNPFLSLLNSVEATRSKLPVVAPKKNSVMEDFVQQLQKKLADFLSNATMSEIILQPMEKPKRTLVHEIVGDYPTLLSFSYGDFAERHVRVYRKGEEPQDVEPAPPPPAPQLLASALQAQPPQRMKRKAASSAAIPEGELVEVHQVGRW